MTDTLTSCSSVSRHRYAFIQHLHTSTLLPIAPSCMSISSGNTRLPVSVWLRWRNLYWAHSAIKAAQTGRSIHANARPKTHSRWEEAGWRRTEKSRRRLHSTHALGRWWWWTESRHREARGKHALWERRRQAMWSSGTWNTSGKSGRWTVSHVRWGRSLLLLRGRPSRPVVPRCRELFETRWRPLKYLCRLGLADAHGLRWLMLARWSTSKVSRAFIVEAGWRWSA